MAMMMACGMAPAAAFRPSHPGGPLNTSLGPFQHEVTAVSDGGSLHLAWTEAFWPGMESRPPPGGDGGAFINHTCAFSTSSDGGASWAPSTLHKLAGMIGANAVVAAFASSRRTAGVDLVAPASASRSCFLVHT